MARIDGTPASETLTGTSGNDVIYGYDGNDILNGGDGQDTLDGGDGNDTYYIANARQVIADTSGSDVAYVSASFAKIPSAIERVIYQGGAQALPYWVDALLPNEAAGLSFLNFLGPAKTYSYAFPTALPSYDTDADNAKGWSALSATQQQRVKQALSYISSVVDLSFVQTSNAAALNTMAFANNTQTDSSGYAQYPIGDAMEGSDVFLDNSSDSPSNAAMLDGTYGALVLIHEIGHALGLEHPGNYNAGGGSTDAPYLSAAEDDTAWTVMSYTDSPSQYLLQYSPLDIAALQYLYGPSKTSRTGNDTYTVSASAPNFIWDGSGVDTISAATSSQGWTLHLTPGYWGYAGSSMASYITRPGQVTVNFGTTIEGLIGSGYADSLYGSDIDNTIDGGAGSDLIDGGRGTDTLSGAAGDDTVTGGAGNDAINGGAGTDTAVFAGARQSYSLRIDRVKSTVTVTDQQSGRDGTDTLVDLEKLQFGGQSFSVYNNASTSAPKYGLNNTFLFDAAYYLLSNPSLIDTVSLSAAPQHYLSTGAKAGLVPNDWFSATYYANKWADLKNANLDDATLFQHYNLYGVWEGRSAGTRFDQFDGNRYLSNNPDVAGYVDAAIADFLGSRTNGAIAHYIIYGAAEGRVAYDTTGAALTTVLVIGASAG